MLTLLLEIIFIAIALTEHDYKIISSANLGHHSHDLERCLRFAQRNN